MSKQEKSESGSPIFRHQARDRGMEPPSEGAVHLPAIEQHLENHLGKVETVYHEMMSDLIHLDVLFIPASSERPYHSLVTSGVSDRPMTVPEGMEEFRHVELMVNLPSHWPLDQESFKDEANYWPIRWLKQIGRLPHQYDTWIGWGHTIPNGDPPEPIANSPFAGVMLSPPYWLSPEFFQLQIPAGPKITFYQLMPLYREEMELKLSQGLERLEELFEKHETHFILDNNRKNVAL